MLNSETISYKRGDEELENEASTPASPEFNAIPSPEKRINEWLEAHDIFQGSPGLKKRQYFQKVKDRSNLANPTSPLIESSLENSGLIQRRSRAFQLPQLQMTKSDPFAVRPQIVPEQD